MSVDITPQEPFILVELSSTPAERSASGLYLPSGSQEISSGTVVALPDTQVSPAVGPALAVGSEVLYLKDKHIEVDSSKRLALVPRSALLAIQNDTTRAEPPRNEAPPFFALEPWGTFKQGDHERWREYTNATKFTFAISFLEPFRPLAHIGRILYEECVAELRGQAGVQLNQIEYSEKKEREADSASEAVKERTSYIIRSNHDKWDGAAVLVEGRNVLQLVKLSCSLENLHETVPSWLAAVARVIRHGAFRAIVGADYSRIQNVSCHLHQRFRLHGRGTRKEHLVNSDLMQQFLRLDSADQMRPATLQTLGMAQGSIGRVDIKLGFDKTIEHHPYTIWMDVKAPSNDEHSQLEIDWNIQDNNPGNLATREYGPVFETFIRDTVFRTFYVSWFQENDDVVATTELH